MSSVYIKMTFLNADLTSRSISVVLLLESIGVDMGSM